MGFSCLTLPTPRRRWSRIGQEWSQHESYKCGSIASLPVWIRLPEIWAHLTDVTILGYLCSRIGKPICTDGVTVDGSRLSYARVCVEIFADMDFIDNTEYEDPYGTSIDKKFSMNGGH